jgi:RimJ/RimL family protein N-acetyltransferase
VSHTIETKRLTLVSMGPALMRALLAGDTAAAEALLGARMPEDWPGLSDVFRMRLDQLEARPEDEPWLTRAIVLKIESRVIGVTGFHGRPGGAWLRDYAPAGLEFGYTIFEGFRRRGYAAEAGRALIQWAMQTHGVQSFVLSMGPTNDASIGVARKLGFHRAGEWVHPQRGREVVYVRTMEKPAGLGELS